MLPDRSRNAITANYPVHHAATTNTVPGLPEDAGSQPNRRDPPAALAGPQLGPRHRVASLAHVAAATPEAA